MVTSQRNMRPLRVAAAVTTGVALVMGGAGLAVAATGAATTTVNIRSGPSTSKAVKGSLVRGQRITVTGRSKPGWVKVNFAGSSAYIAAKYIDSSGKLPAAPKKISTSGTKVVTEDLNVRTGPSSRYRVVGTLPEGRKITLSGKQSGGFAQTTYAGHTRWVAVAYLAKSRSGGGSSTGGGSGSSSAPKTSAAKGRAALAFAKRQLGKPYQWGAEGPARYDCSGLVLAAWNSVGVSMPRTARAQYAAERRISKSQLRPGDLVFYYGQTPKHVAMYVGNGRIIHAPRPGTKVRYSTLNAMPYAGAVRPS